MGPRFYPQREVAAYCIIAYGLTACIVCFGPILGVVAAGIEFGAYGTNLAEKGERLRATASYVRLSPFVCFVCMNPHRSSPGSCFSI